MNEESDKMIEEINRHLELNSNKSSKASDVGDEEQESRMDTDAEAPTPAATASQNDLQLQEKKEKHQQSLFKLERFLMASCTRFKILIRKFSDAKIASY